MSKKIIALVAIAALMLLPVVAYAATSGASITSSQTGAKGSDVTYNAGTAYLSGNNSSSSTNVLYIAAQKIGYYEIGGVVKTFGVPAGVTLGPSVATLTTGGFHVLLDPSGPLMSGCTGSGKLVQ